MKDIKVLGAGCANCKKTVALIDQLARERGVEIKLEKVEEMRDILGYGVMSTPWRRRRRPGRSCRRRSQP